MSIIREITDSLAKPFQNIGYFVPTILTVVAIVFGLALFMTLIAG